MRCEKKVYDSESAARRSLRGLQQSHQRGTYKGHVYYCKKCKGFHFGSTQIRWHKKGE
jgi:hypothetical protein